MGQVLSISLAENDDYLLVNTVGDVRALRRPLPALAACLTAAAAAAASAPQAVRMWSLESRKLLRPFAGLRQKRFIIRSAFGGAHQSLIASGSEGTPHACLVATCAAHTRGRPQTRACTCGTGRMLHSCNCCQDMRGRSAVWHGRPRTPAPLCLAATMAA